MRHKEQREVIGVVGAGVVGGSLISYLRQHGHDVRVFDPPQGLDDVNVLDEAEFVFVCVPTPYTPGIGFDDRHLLDAVARVPGNKTIVIKSTVLPGTTELLQRRYRQHRFMFNPEFLREATAAEDFVNPDRQIVGVTEASAHEGLRLMALLPRAPFQQVCGASEAEMAKYAANSFLAVKVSFANELFDICDRLRIDYASVKEMVGADARIGTSHMDVFDAGYRGYGGKCLPKDSKALLDLARSVDVDLDVLRAADRVNARLRPSTQLPVSPLRPVEVVAARAAGEQAA
jgi:UDPglucose 6-dehydrogenase